VNQESTLEATRTRTHDRFAHIEPASDAAFVADIHQESAMIIQDRLSTQRTRGYIPRLSRVGHNAFPVEVV
jgi:hypothetical protein